MLMDFQNSKIFEYSSEIVTGTMLRSHCDAEDSGTRRLRTERNQIGDNVPWRCHVSDDATARLDSILTAKQPFYLLLLLSDAPCAAAAVVAKCLVSDE